MDGSPEDRQTVRVAIWRVRGGASALPTYMTADAAGCDLAADLDAPLTLAPLERSLVPTGFAIALPPGFEAQVRPRSGLAAKNSVSVANTPGTIDPDYRGEVKVLLINHGKTPFVVTRGMRIAQMLVVPVPRVAWIEVDELPSTDRGSGGFGHTGR